MEHIEADSPTLSHACKMSLEGIVSKRKASPYRSGRSPDWIKSKNPACEAVRREAKEDRPMAAGGASGRHQSVDVEVRATAGRG